MAVEMVIVGNGAFLLMTSGCDKSLCCEFPAKTGAKTGTGNDTYFYGLDITWYVLFRFDWSIAV